MWEKRNFFSHLYVLTFFLILTVFIFHNGCFLAMLPSGVSFYNTGTGTATVNDLKTIRSYGYDTTGYLERNDFISADNGRGTAITVYYVDANYFLQEVIPITAFDEFSQFTAVIGESTSQILYQSKDCIGNVFYVGDRMYTVSAVYDDSEGLWQDSVYARSAGRRQVLFLPLRSGEKLDVIRIVSDLPAGAVKADINARSPKLLDGYLGVRCRDEAQFFVPLQSICLISAIFWMFVWMIRRLLWLKCNYNVLSDTKRRVWYGFSGICIMGIIMGFIFLPQVLPNTPEWFSLPENIFCLSEYRLLFYNILSQLGKISANISEIRIAIDYMQRGIQVIKIYLFLNCMIIVIMAEWQAFGWCWRKYKTWK